jgi:hypothetical protein
MVKSKSLPETHKIPALPLEGTIGLLLTVIMAILEQLRVSSGLIFWTLFSLGFGLIVHAVLGSKWTAYPQEREVRILRRILGTLVVCISFGCFGLWILPRPQRIQLAPGLLDQVLESCQPAACSQRLQNVRNKLANRTFLR